MSMGTSYTWRTVTYTTGSFGDFLIMNYSVSIIIIIDNITFGSVPLMESSIVT